MAFSPTLHAAWHHRVPTVAGPAGWAQGAAPTNDGPQVLAAGTINATSLDSIKGIILGLCGTALIIILAIRALGYFANEKYGKFAGMAMAGVVVAGFVYFPDQLITMLKGLWSSIVGGQA